MSVKKKTLGNKRKEMQESTILACKTKDIDGPEKKKRKARMYQINANIQELEQKMNILEQDIREILGKNIVERSNTGKKKKEKGYEEDTTMKTTGQSPTDKALKDGFLDTE